MKDVSIIFRPHDRPTAEDYDQVISDLQMAKTQLEPDGLGCILCSDSDHHAFECRFNALAMARKADQNERTWRCYHCGFCTDSYEEAEEHFGRAEHVQSGCALVVRSVAHAEYLMTQHNFAIDAFLRRLGWTWVSVNSLMLWQKEIEGAVVTVSAEFAMSIEAVAEQERCTCELDIKPYDCPIHEAWGH